ncbi:MAG: M1 family peptidase, partial [Pseudomonadota bacterium]|nr:M1 family peptidase [Pseudomonadota bacterium]
ETASGQDLRGFFDQWLTRPGAPVVRIAEAGRTKSDSGYRVKVTLEQAVPEYRLRVPVAIRTGDGEEFHTLDLERGRQAFTFDMRALPLEVTLDPDLRLFRRLMPDEAPPILRQIMVDRTAITVLLPKGGEARGAAETLAGKLQNRALKLVSVTDSLPAVPALVIGLQEQVDAWLARNQLPERPEIVRGKGSAQAWTVSHSDGVTLAVVSARDAASLAVLIRPLPHYGRQSYVIFDGAKVIERGAWPTRVQVMKFN